MLRNMKYMYMHATSINTTVGLVPTELSLQQKRQVRARAHSYFSALAPLIKRTQRRLTHLALRRLSACPHRQRSSSRAYTTTRSGATQSGATRGPRATADTPRMRAPRCVGEPREAEFVFGAMLQ